MANWKWDLFLNFQGENTMKVWQVNYEPKKMSETMKVSVESKLKILIWLNNNNCWCVKAFLMFRFSEMKICKTNEIFSFNVTSLVIFSTVSQQFNNHSETFYNERLLFSTLSWFISLIMHERLIRTWKRISLRVNFHDKSSNSADVSEWEGGE